jgi:hypothetical protein
MMLEWIRLLWAVSPAYSVQPAPEAQGFRAVWLADAGVAFAVRGDQGVVISADGVRRLSLPTSEGSRDRGAFTHMDSAGRVYGYRTSESGQDIVVFVIEGAKVHTIPGLTHPVSAGALGASLVGVLPGTEGRGAAFAFREGTLRALPMPEGWQVPAPAADFDSAATATAESIVVGWVRWAEGQLDSYRPAIWTGGVASLLPLPPGATHAIVQGVNRRGLAVGSSSALPYGYKLLVATMQPQLHWRACVWEAGAVRMLAPPGRSAVAEGRQWSTEARGVNDAGDVVGRLGVGDSDGQYRFRWSAVLWKQGVLIDLNDHLPREAGYRLVNAVAVNDRGNILCEASPENGAEAGTFPVVLRAR